jgi:hypothetical protein
MDEVDFTILAATSVFTDFMDKCPPAEACRDAFDRTVKATLKMVNASGGFGQQYHPGQGSGGSSARSSLEHSRLDWSSRSDTTSLSNKPHHRRHRPQPSIDHASTLTPTDAYSTSASPSSLLSAFQKGAQYRLPGSGPATVKSEPDGFSLMRNLPLPPRSNASSAENPVTPEATIAADATMAQPQRPTPSTAATAAQLSSPVAEMVVGTPTGGGYLSPQQQRQQQSAMFSPGAVSYADLQGMEFLQNLPAGGGGGGDGGGSGTGVGVDGIDFSGLADTQMDLGFGLGWEGLHHDYSEGQQLDLFDGFFFGGQQGGAG